MIKAERSLAFILIILIAASCGQKDKTSRKTMSGKLHPTEIIIPVDKGFSKYIAGYTSGKISVNSPIEIRLTPEFAEKAGKRLPSALFTFEPFIKGKAEWDGETSIIFKPDKILDPGKDYKVSFNLGRIADVEEKLRVFPIRIQTIKKDFLVTTGILECTDNGNKYTLHGELIASDYIASSEVEAYLRARTGRQEKKIFWDHTDMLVHLFTIPDIARADKSQALDLIWDGTKAGVRQKGAIQVPIPGKDEFVIVKVIEGTDEGQKTDIIFSDPLDPSQEIEGLVWLNTGNEITTSINNNVISLFPSQRIEGKSMLTAEGGIRNIKGAVLGNSHTQEINFGPLMPAVEFAGKGVIIPASKNLVLPFRAVSLNAVDLKIIRIYDNNLPYFLQENEINTGYSVKRFGRPVYSGRIDLVNNPGKNAGTWNLYTIDLSEYIDVEPGALYKAELSMRPSYSLYPCTDGTDLSRYEEFLAISEESNRDFWDDPYYFYSESDDYIYYSFGFEWRDRNDPCKAAYYSPDRKVSRNILASNLGIMAKKGQDDKLYVSVSDLLTALPLTEVSVDVFDLQLQKIVSGQTDKNGKASLKCERKPFLLVAYKDKDRNYLKLTDGSALSMSSFDVSGSKPEKGIRAFIYGERDVWRPGDSIFLSLFIRDMNHQLPADHPVQFELINPLGQRVDNQVQVPGKTGLMVFRSATPSDAVTGSYQGIFRIGGATFTKRVRIETVKPNRLKIELNFAGDLLGKGGAPGKGSLRVKWLNGAVAGNLKSTVEYLFKPVSTEFDGYRQYTFDDPATAFYSETVKMFEGSVDQQGTAEVNFNPGNDIIAPGMLNVLFTARVSEKGGDESIIQKTSRYSPYSIYTGVSFPQLKGNERMLYTDRDNEVRIVTLNPQGKPVRSEVEINIYKISYRWWWESDEENIASYISNNIYRPVISQTITTQGGEGSFRFRIGRNDWGRYLIRATGKDGHSSGKILLVDWPWEYGMKGNTEGATLLSVNTDKEKYAPGEEIKLTFPAPENARAIVTLENSVSVIDEIRTGATKGNTSVSFRAKPEMAPNIYAYVTVIQPHEQTINDMPMRLYGVVPVMVEDPASRLKPVISIPEEVRSKESFEVRVAESEKKAMNYTLAIVDEGLLDISGFRTPDPWNYFYSREALGVQTWDLYDQVLGAFGGTLDRLFATGGDEALTDKTASKAQRFIPVVRFLGPFSLQAGKTGIHHISLPQYTGSVRTMVIAGNDRAFGSTEKTTTVKDPLMILATAPRVLSQGEKVTLPVTLFIQKESIQNVVVKAEANNLIRFDENMKTVSAGETGEKDIEFTFRAGDETGVANIKITATGGGENAVYELQVGIRNPNPPETRAETRILSPGEKWDASFMPLGTSGTASLELSALPSINLGKRLDYLLEYPHGCTEQIISAAFPQLYLKDAVAGDLQAAEKASANIRDAINKITARQMNDGGMAPWPGSLQADEWITSYTGHFMAEAEGKGFSIPSGYRQKWNSFQRKRAQDWRFDKNHPQSAVNQAYRLYTLALAGQPERGAMNRLRESAGLPQVSKWLLAGAYALTGRTEVAGDLLDMRNTGTEKEYSGYYYGSDLRDQAIILYTLSILKKQEEALPLLKSLCDSFSGDNWYSTQTTAWVLMAYMKFTEMMPAGGTGEIRAGISYNGERSEQQVMQKQVTILPLAVKDGTNSLTVQNISEKPLYATLVRKGTPKVTDVTRENRGLGMTVNYYDTSLQPVDPLSLEQGTDFIMVVKVVNNTYSAVENIALTQVIPSGWEIRNTRLYETEYGIKESARDYRDIRDDRLNTYFSLNRGETKTFMAILNAAYRGEFSLPPVWCEAMYTGDCYARIPGGTVNVTSSGIGY